jgi:hypothetical protein
MDSSKLRALLIIVFALLCALYLGVTAATAQLETAIWVGGGLFMVFCIALGKNIWIIIPPLAYLQGTANFLPGTPPPWALAAAVVAAMYTLRFATRRHNFVFHFTWLDFVMILQVLAVAQAWVRNPTGLLMLGGEFAGGKSYFVFAAVALAYACLSITMPSLQSIRWCVIAMVTFLIFDGIVLTLSDYVPAFAKVSLRIYGGNIGSAISGQALDIVENRGGFGMGVLSKNLLTALFCLLPTIRCINPIHIISFTLTILGSGLALLSGFRSLVGYAVVMYSSAAIARRRYLDILLACVFGFFGTIAVLASGNIDKLPFGIQRIFTIVGADVRRDVSESADDSSEERFEMWKTVLTSDEFIKNKWLGDGFAVTAREQLALFDTTMGYNSRMGLDTFTERSLATGSYHGFHVETIRFTGYLGLACAVTAMVIFFWKGLELIKHFRGQPLFGPVLYLCLPVMIYLFWSLLVFGSYRVDFPPILIMSGALKMLDNLRLTQNSELAAAKLA